jgi:hypothetical protein
LQPTIELETLAAFAIVGKESARIAIDLYLFIKLTPKLRRITKGRLLVKANGHAGLLLRSKSPRARPRRGSSLRGGGHKAVSCV